MAMTVFRSTQQWTDPVLAYENWKAALKSDDRAREYRFYRFEAAAVKILDEKSFGDAVFVRASVLRQ